MTIRSMYRAAALFLVALTVAACGDEPPAASASDLAAARAETERALEAVADLTDRLDSLESEVSDSRRATKELGDDLDAAVGDLKTSLKELRGKVGDAVASVEGAAGDISVLVRRITVLEERYEFHLKRYHGGG